MQRQFHIIAELRATAETDGGVRASTPERAQRLQQRRTASLRLSAQRGPHEGKEEEADVGD